MVADLIKEQIELEKRTCEKAINRYYIEKAKQPFGATQAGTKLTSIVLEDYTQAIQKYLNDYLSGKAVKSTIAANVISRNPVEIVAFVAARVIFNAVATKHTITSVYKAIGQALEDELKMRECKGENKKYYETIQRDLNSRQAKANRRKYITTGVFEKRLDFHVDRWTITEKFHAGIVLLNLFIDTTGLVKFVDSYTKKNKCVRTLEITETLLDFVQKADEKLEVLNPIFVPMVCKPKDWTGIFEGGYISPYLKRNRLIKNDDREYLNRIKNEIPTKVYTALNHIQSTAWQINKEVLNVVKELWNIGKPIAEIPCREDKPIMSFPFPDKTQDSTYTEEETEIVKQWKRETYETHKENVKMRSQRLLTATLINIAEQFRQYDKIYFPYNMDFRGRMYPIPVLLQPQGSDLAKGLLRFSEGKALNDTGKKWFKIQGANLFGYDKVSYAERVLWTDKEADRILSYAENPVDNTGWAEADKPFQFLAWCFEFRDFYNNPDNFKSHLPVQLDGTCNGLQHYSALLKDKVAGKAVNLINTPKPSDIYETVADKLKEKLKTDNSETSKKWLQLGINRKLTKRPVMVLPYGGTQLSCREYVTEYLNDNYSNDYLWKFFGQGETPNACIFSVSQHLSRFLWQSIKEVLRSAIVGMSFLKSVAKAVKGSPIEWINPLGLRIRQGYKSRTHHIIRTELYGKIKSINVKTDTTILDNIRQQNGICPNYIHSMDAACLMLYLNKCKEVGINSIMSVHDCYGTHAADTETSARLLREAFVEVYERPLIDDFIYDVLDNANVETEIEQPETGGLDIKEVLKSDYFFN